MSKILGAALEALKHGGHGAHYISALGWMAATATAAFLAISGCAHAGERARYVSVSPPPLIPLLPGVRRCFELLHVLPEGGPAQRARRLRFAGRAVLSLATALAPLWVPALGGEQASGAALVAALVACTAAAAAWSVLRSIPVHEGH